MRFLLLPTLFATLGIASPGRADEPRISSSVEEPAPSRLTWYGYQPILADMGTISLTFANTAAFGGTGLWTGLGTWALAAPTIHAVHGRWGAAGASLALRVILPFVLRSTFASSCRRDQRATSDAYEDCLLDADVKGFMIGMGSAIVIDAAALSWETKKAAALTPTASLDAHGVTLGLGGTF